MNTKQIKKEFNTLAAKLGSRARIGGNAKTIEFQMYIGESNGFEQVIKIDSNKFAQLIANYPQLH